MSEAAPAPQQGQPQQQQQQAPPQPAFHETLEHGLSGHTGLAKFKDVNQLAKSYIELQGKLGQQQAPQQRQSARPEQYNPKAYGLHRENQVQKWDAQARQAWEAGIEPSAFVKWAKSQSKQQKSQQRQQQMDQQIRNQEARNTLRQHWGENFGANMKAAEYAAKTLDLVDDIKNMKGGSNNPRVMNALAKVGNMLADDRTLGIKGGSQAFGGAPTPEMLDGQANKLTADAWSPGVDAARRERILAEAMELRQRSARARGLT